MISKKILPLLLASTLATSSFVTCEASFSPKHVSHLMAGMYTVLGLFSAKQLLESVERTFDLVIDQEKKPVADFKNLNDKAFVFTFLHLLNFTTTAFFGYLIYFSIKNIFKELLKKHEVNKEKQEKEKPKEINTAKNIA